MASIRPSSRYAFVDDSISRSPKNRIISNRYTANVSENNDCRAIMKAPSFQVSAAGKLKSGSGLGSMVKKFMEKRSAGSKAGRNGLTIPTDPIAGGGKGSSGISRIHQKLFQRGSSDQTPTKALTEVKSNTRTVAMVLRSERELMNQNKQFEEEISELMLMLQEKNREVEKLKDLCLKQREEIKSLKDAVLFPDVMNSQLQQMLKSNRLELKHANQVIPNLREQVSHLTGQLQCLAEGLAEVKSDKYLSKRCSEGYMSSPKTPILFGEASNSLEYSSGDPFTLAPDSPDDMFLNDFNPCLTPRYGKTARESDEMFESNTISKAALFQDNGVQSSDVPYSARITMLSKSSEPCPKPSFAAASQKVHKSDESKWSADVYQKLF